MHGTQPPDVIEVRCDGCGRSLRLEFTELNIHAQIRERGWVTLGWGIYQCRRCARADSV